VLAVVRDEDSWSWLTRAASVGGIGSRCSPSIFLKGSTTALRWLAGHRAQGGARHRRPSSYAGRTAGVVASMTTGAARPSCAMKAARVIQQLRKPADKRSNVLACDAISASLPRASPAVSRKRCLSSSSSTGWQVSTDWAGLLRTARSVGLLVDMNFFTRIAQRAKESGVGQTTLV